MANIIGISALYHNSACCLVQNGELKIAAEEERFTRVKHDSSMPRNVFRYCLEGGSISINDIDAVAYYELPDLKLERQKWSGITPETLQHMTKMDFRRPEKLIRDVLGYEGKILYYKHHLSHAASSYLYSDFTDSAILTVDGVGEWETTTYGHGINGDISIFNDVKFPHSFGLLYATITNFLGFGINSGEYKVMGLAPYGKPIYADSVRKLFQLEKEGQYQLNLQYFDFIKGKRMYSDKLTELLGMPPRIPESELKQEHMDVARSLQMVLEEVMLHMADYVYDRTKSENLCLAGGVALNCVANGRLKRDSKFKNIFIQPAANDAGGAVGAAALAYRDITGERVCPITSVYLGPEYSDREIFTLLSQMDIVFEDYQENKEGFLNRCAELLAQQKVIAWFQNKMEFGARALGCRSILADPRVGSMRDRINAMVKKRESFRPFAPVVMEDQMSDYFDFGSPSPYMLFTCNVVSKTDLPAITHVDNSARIQTVNETQHPLYYKLINRFYHLTNCPMLLNTSFNVRDEPIVMTPMNAIHCFIGTKIDYLAIGSFIVHRNRLLSKYHALYERLHMYINEDYKKNENNVYTFL